MLNFRKLKLLTQNLDSAAQKKPENELYKFRKALKRRKV